MHELAKKLIVQRIEKILQEWDFEKRKKENPKECFCYTEGKCHNIPDLNCFFCYCPEYDLSKQEGGCRINDRRGNWFYHNNLPKGKIWDCSGCDFPHKKENIKKYLLEIFKKG